MNAQKVLINSRKYRKLKESQLRTTYVKALFLLENMVSGTKGCSLLTHHDPKPF